MCLLNLYFVKKPRRRAASPTFFALSKSKIQSINLSNLFFDRSLLESGCNFLSGISSYVMGILKGKHKKRFFLFPCLTFLNFGVLPDNLEQNEC